MTFSASRSVLSVFLLGSALMGMMPSAVYAQTPPSGAAQADAEEGVPKVSWGGACGRARSTVPAQACDKLGCYAPDCLGGWGLRPRRTYKLVYDGDPVCKVIVKTLNDTLRMDPKEAIRRVTHPMPRPDKIENLRWGHHDFYRSQNPLFSDPIFTQWNFIQGGTSGDNGSRFAIGDAPLEYWQILPYKNDGVDRLVTIHTNPSDKYRSVIQPPFMLLEWDIPADKLKMEDWSYYKSYLPYEEVNDGKIGKGCRQWYKESLGVSR
ncbi:MAG: hypothetical protein IPI58_00845 [Alphaproteobacteria bacterium]|nr:MAG: hypothetical protein IPI58_00845 [Alphaproteobacteria bacterium]